MKTNTARRDDASATRSTAGTQPPPARNRHQASGFPIRILTAVPICDGHDSAINTINLELIHNGIEVIYLGYHRLARDIARAAMQEDARAIGISSYNGGHVRFFGEVIEFLKKNGAGDIGVFGGGGGTITPADAHQMVKKGVDRIFFAGTRLAEIVEFVKTRYGAPRIAAASGTSVVADRRLAKLLTAAEMNVRGSTFDVRRSGKPSRVVGITGPGGAGKTTLIDELAMRFLRSDPKARLAILSHDPSLAGQGALLGDRATMIYSQDERVFMRSLATRGQAGGLSPATKRCLQVLKRSGFDLVLVETVGIGQEAMPFGRESIDQTVLVMSPGYGGRLQLQKIVMMQEADVVVVNKSDLAGAKTATAEIEQYLVLHHRGQKLISTVAKRHRDPGVDELFRWLGS